MTRVLQITAQDRFGCNATQMAASVSGAVMTSLIKPVGNGFFCRDVIASTGVASEFNTKDGG